jgi:hypothetical protein
MYNPRHLWWLHWYHLNRLDGCDENDHRAGQNSTHVHCSRDDLVRTSELTTSPRERFLKRCLWRQRTGMRKVHPSWSVILAILMMTESSRGSKSPTNAVLPSTGVWQCSNSLQCPAQPLYDDDTCRDWLVSCRDMGHPLHPLFLIPLSSSPLFRATLLCSYLQQPMTMLSWSNWLSFGDDSMTRLSPRGWRAKGMSLYLMKRIKALLNACLRVILRQ